MKLPAVENQHPSSFAQMEAVSIQTGLGLGVVAAKDGCARSAGRMETPACCDSTTVRCIRS
jgi:hypothetical protein